MKDGSIARAAIAATFMGLVCCAGRSNGAAAGDGEQADGSAAAASGGDTAVSTGGAGTGSAEHDAGLAGNRASCTGASPEAPCSGSGICLVRHCGLTAGLECVAGRWVVAREPTDPLSTPWDFVCSREQEGAATIEQVREEPCCGETQTCEECPGTVPEDGSACALPTACAAAPVMNCFYPCCCYGSTSWAQCDGERWHVATDCSPL